MLLSFSCQVTGLEISRTFGEKRKKNKEPSPIIINGKRC